MYSLGSYCERVTEYCEQFENTLRRHNHLGLVHALLIALAKEGKLHDAVEDSKKTMQARNDKARRNKLATDLK